MGDTSDQIYALLEVPATLQWKLCRLFQFDIIQLLIYWLFFWAWDFFLSDLDLFGGVCFLLGFLRAEWFKCCSFPSEWWPIVSLLPLLSPPLPPPSAFQLQRKMSHICSSSSDDLFTSTRLISVQFDFFRIKSFTIDSEDGTKGRRGIYLNNMKW